jgi:hypothetical protein
MTNANALMLNANAQSPIELPLTIFPMPNGLRAFAKDLKTQKGQGLMHGK